MQNIIKKQNITILGCGRWGSFLAWYANRIGHNVVSWGREDDIFRAIKETRKNEYVELDEKIEITNDLEFALHHSDIIIISINAQALRNLLTVVTKHDIKNKKFVLCMKGVEEVTCLRLSEVCVSMGIDKDNVAVWVGPGHIQDFTKSVPNAMVIDSVNKELTKELVDVLKSNLIRFYYGTDMIGTEIGAATKNIFGIIAGALDGMGYPALKGPLMARGTREVARLIEALGGNELSAYGLCHLGDYETTLFSKHSNNRAWGEAVVKGEKFLKLAEGVATARAVSTMAKKLGVEMPLTDTVNQIVQTNTNAIQILQSLFNREIITEF
ncbi:MAG: NAD(P)H-dependent glycerol-3-phosphate dehydrogenase [Firmicutes bacterium]|nr:NAD(P)H-dependent glycerol-3-phosphate dehydrogenase [Bacillota bacterium]MCL2256290.1 NAD(P)H-dependent glycerol-3-phosphate dehydrogenase [Bacillota bacterium]